jgi:mRNA interferase RelE/StbE
MISAAISRSRNAGGRSAPNVPRYELVISNRFRRDLRRLDAQVHRRVLVALDALQTNPYQGQQLTEVQIGQWRIRVGDYRIRYDIEGNRVLLYRVRHRKDIYRE